MPIWLQRQKYLIDFTLSSLLRRRAKNAGLLLVYTLEDLHGLFVGAMCATGSLNANPVGWTLLAVKLLLVDDQGRYKLSRRAALEELGNAYNKAAAEFSKS